MTRSPRALLAVLALLAAGGAEAIDGSAGTAAGAALVLGGSARSLAMGGAGVAGLREPGAIWVNPAGLAEQEGIGAGSFLHGSYFEDIAVDQVALAVPVPAGTVGAAYASMRLGTIESLDKNGAQSAVPLTPGDWAAAAAWAGRRGRLAAGASAWYLHSELAPDSAASAWAGDVGTWWNPSAPLTLGASVQHLGSGLKFASATAALPLLIRAGAGYAVGRTGLSLAADAVKPSDDAVGFRLGAEERAAVAKGWWVELRGGWRSGAPAHGSATGLSAGLGVDWRPAVSTGERDERIAVEPVERFGISAVRVEYAWTPMGELGQAHWFSFAIGF